jgi:hypothetical protein
MQFSHARVLIADPRWEEWHTFYAEFNLNHNHVNAAPNTHASIPLHVHITKQPPSRKMLYEKSINKSEEWLSANKY